MAGKVTTASEQVYDWIQENHEKHGIDSALEAIKKALPDNKVVQALSRDALRIRAISRRLHFSDVKPRIISKRTKRVLEWLESNHEKHTAESAPEAVTRDLGLTL